MARDSGDGCSMRKEKRRWAVSSMLSMMSSREVASEWMSSRSNGVMKLRSSALMIRSTIRSQACSSWRSSSTPRRQVVELVQHDDELVGGAGEQGGGFLEHVEELFFSRNPAEAHQRALLGVSSFLQGKSDRYNHPQASSGCLGVTVPTILRDKAAPASPCTANREDLGPERPGSFPFGLLSAIPPSGRAFASDPPAPERAEEGFPPRRP